MSAVVTLEAVGKTFGPVTALADVSFDIRAGEIHALMGENGAGKSTLIKVLAGIHQHSSGEVRVDDRAVRFKNPKESRSVGIRTVFQELSIVPSLTVAENVVLGEAPGSRAFVNPKDVRRQAAEALELLGVELDLDRPARSLARSEQQLIEIARALRHQPRVLILDEPTASLGHEESRRLLTIVDGLRARGVAVLYVSHRMAEVVEIADRVTVLRDGRYVNTSERPIIEDELVERMIGRPAETLYQHTARTPGEEVLRVEGLNTRLLRDVAMHVRRGEIVGIAGLIGCGKSDIGRALFGLEPSTVDRVRVGGADVRPAQPSKMLRRGLVYYPADRRREGLVPMRAIRESMTLGAHRAGGLTTNGLIRTKNEQQRCREFADKLDMRPRDVERRAQSYSGGNQQKAVLARGLLRDSDVHIFDEPTVGIDVGAKADVYRLLGSYADRGCGVVMISSDLTELVGVSDRIYVVAEGRITAHLKGAEIDADRVGRAMFGLPATPDPEPSPLPSTTTKESVA
ncbi:sugar ABC transporter ATP-binding protein [Gordonia westfalica]|uniref:Ribose transport system ATP-binding protein n=1 Tax=Gordonia westfalica TaxID=158898 RepID=A0A1H2KVU2_9ACTN|nr:sugar ABC transporter ATP-binding protein [Gordonia westfalica]SDU72823.1 ribose transport system ATP-binding protein [Gordonia westfalica]